MVFIRTNTLLADNTVCTLLTNTILTPPVTGTPYLIASSTNDSILKGYENEVATFDGTDFLTQIRDEGHLIVVSGETLIYSAVSGWLKAEHYTSTKLNGSSSSGGGGGTPLTQAETTAAFQTALASQNAVEFQDLVLEDSTGTLFFRTKTIDEETGAIVLTNTLPNGSAFTPVGAISISGKTDSTAIRNNTATKVVSGDYFLATNGGGSGYAQGDYLVRHYLYDSLGNANPKWYNLTQGGTVILPPAQTSIKLWNRIVDQGVGNTANNTNIANSYLSATYSNDGGVTDVAVTSAANGTKSARLRGLQVQAEASRLTLDATKVVVGSTTDVAVSSTQNGTIEARLRGLQATTEDQTNYLVALTGSATEKRAQYNGESEFNYTANFNGEIYVEFDTKTLQYSEWYSFQEEFLQDNQLQVSDDQINWRDTIRTYQAAGTVFSENGYLSGDPGDTLYFRPNAKYFRIVAAGATYPSNVTIRTCLPFMEQRVAETLAENQISLLSNISTLDSTVVLEKRLVIATAFLLGKYSIGDVLEQERSVSKTNLGIVNTTQIFNLTQKAQLFASNETVAVNNFIYVDALASPKILYQSFGEAALSTFVLAGANNNCIISSVFIENLSNTTAFFQLYKGATTVANLVQSFRILPNGTFTWEPEEYGFILEGGNTASWAVSSTAGSYTPLVINKSITIRGNRS